MKLNVARAPIHTHEGAVAQHINATQQLRRSVMACMLWEDSFYESGEDIAARIVKLVAAVPAEEVSAIAVEARTKMKLRHAPLLICAAMAAPSGAQRHVVAKTLEAVIQRADELTEFIAIYAKVWGVAPSAVKKRLSAQCKKGLAKAFAKFNEYSLAKYDRDGAVKLRDVLFLSHSKPSDAPARKRTKVERKLSPDVELSPREALYARIVNGSLVTPDTWEVALSGGADKRETFERLINEKKLGALALLRNLRNMEQAGVPKPFVAAALSTMDAERVLPFRFIAAARALPQWEDIVEPAMLKCAEAIDRLPGRTLLLIDVSGSMDGGISGKSDLRRVDAACQLAILVRELAEDAQILTFSNNVVQVAPRRGFALRDAILGSQPHSGTYLGQAVAAVDAKLQYDRIIVITDEQSHDSVPAPKGKGYVINVAAYQNGIGYGPWLHIDGWSEAVLDYIKAVEQ